MLTVLSVTKQSAVSAQLRISTASFLNRPTGSVSSSSRVSQWQFSTAIQLDCAEGNGMRGEGVFVYKMAAAMSNLLRVVTIQLVLNCYQSQRTLYRVVDEVY